MDLNAPLGSEASAGTLVDDRCGRVDLGRSERGGLPNIAGAGAKDSGVFGKDRELLQLINSNDLEPVEGPDDLQLDVRLCASIELPEDGFRDEAISVRGDPLQSGSCAARAKWLSGELSKTADPRNQVRCEDVAGADESRSPLRIAGGVAGWPRVTPSGARARGRPITARGRSARRASWRSRGRRGSARRAERSNLVLAAGARLRRRLRDREQRGRRARATVG